LNDGFGTRSCSVDVLVIVTEWLGTHEKVEKQ
jgi:hypothetical protein